MWLFFVFDNFHETFKTYFFKSLDFSGRCLGVGTRYDLLAELSRREIEAGTKPDSEIDTFMKATTVTSQETILVTDTSLDSV